MYSNKYELNVLVGDKPIREYFHKNKFFVEAKRGTEYTLKLKNHGPKRIMAVFSVDGIDVLKGKSATEAESGYVVNAFSTLTVKGFRIDDANVAAFKFDEPGNSYASIVEQEGDIEKAKQYPSKNNGVIGVRIWEEKETKWVPDWDYRKSLGEDSFLFYDRDRVVYGVSSAIYSGSVVASGALTGSYGGLMISFSGSSNFTGLYGYSGASGASGYSGISGDKSEEAPRQDVHQFGNLVAIDPNFTVGTSWGNRIEDKVVKVTFEKADTFIDLEIFYLERSELINYGVDVDNAKKVFVSGFPKAFGTKEEYCKVPENWRKQ